MPKNEREKLLKVLQETWAKAEPGKFDVDFVDYILANFTHKPTVPDGDLREQLRRIVTRNGKTVCIPELLEDELDKLEALFASQAAAAQERAVKERTDFLYGKYKKLWAGLVAVAPILEKPYPDDPRWSPWTRFVHPRMLMLQAAFRGEDIGELEGMARGAVQPKEQQVKQDGNI